MRSQERKHRSPETPPQHQRGHWGGVLSPHGKPAARRLSFQGAPQHSSLGEPSSREHSLCVHRPRPQRSLRAGRCRPGEGFRKGGGCAAFSGVILDALSLLPPPPLSLSCLSREGPLVSDLQRMWALEGGQGSRMGGEARPRQALPQWGQDAGRGPGTSALLWASTETARPMSLTLRRPAS